LEAAIRDELVERRIQVVEQFRPPGTDLSVDLFIPANIPAVVEIIGNSRLDKAETSLGSSMEQRMHMIAESFGARILLFLVGPGPVVRRVRVSPASAIDIELVLVPISPKLNSRKAAQSAAETIADDLQNREKSALETARKLAFLGAGTKTGALAAGALAAGALPFAGVAGAAVAGLAGFGLFSLFRKSLEPGEEPELPSAEVEEQDMQLIHEAIAKIETSTVAILGVLSSTVDDTRLMSLKIELDHLQTEFGAGHFTACALRAGRCLEFAVYSLAEAWKVPTDEPTGKALAALDSTVKETSTLLLHYRDANETERRKIKKKIIKQTGSMVERVFTAFEELDEEPPKSKTRMATPRNIEAILRDMRRKFGRFPKVRASLDAVLDDINEVLKVRNRAAHANVTGGPCEVSSEEVRKMMIRVQKVIARLAGIGSTILSKGN